MRSVRISRPVGSKEPYSFRAPKRVAVKPVYLGQYPPTTHYAPAIHRFIPAEELYDNRKGRKR